MRKSFILFAVVVALSATIGCGSSPASPSPSRPSFVSPSIPPGDYSLTIRVVDTPLFGIPLFCLDSGLPLASGTATIPVTVERVGTGWRIRPVGAADLGLVVTLEPNGPIVSGTGTGQAVDQVTGVTVLVRRLAGFNADPLFSGRPSGSTIVGDPISGFVEFMLNDAKRSCAATDWLLQPR
jgi:hypothetical protein